MVFPGEQEEEEEDHTATTGGHDTPKKKEKKTLHNFSFTDLNWGTQRKIRSTKIESNGASAVDQRLRRRGRSPPSKFGGEEGIGEVKEEKRSKKEEVTPPWNLRKRRAAACEGNSNEKEEESGVMRRGKLRLTLTKKEMEDDFVAMAGHKPPRRPKKRPRNVQKQIDRLHPASYFRDVTEDLYDVPDAPENGKK